MNRRYLDSDKESVFPNLRRDEYHVTSEEDFIYNCIAYAADHKDAWWWPDEGDGIEWPQDVPKEETLEAFVLTYRTLGYELCGNTELEADFEKVAIYVDSKGVPTHAAKQLPSGRWTSKLGDWEDIEHDSLDALCGDQYGSVVQVLKRPRETT